MSIGLCASRSLVVAPFTDVSRRLSRHCNESARMGLTSRTWIEVTLPGKERVYRGHQVATDGTLQHQSVSAGFNSSSNDCRFIVHAQQQVLGCRRALTQFANQARKVARRIEQIYNDHRGLK